MGLEADLHLATFEVNLDRLTRAQRDMILPPPYEIGRAHV